MSDSEDTVVCPLCQVRVSAVGGGDALQLHYLTSCSGYDKGKIIVCRMIDFFMLILQCRVSQLDQRLQPKLDTQARQISTPQMIQWGYPLVLQLLEVLHPMVWDPPQPLGQLP